MPMAFKIRSSKFRHVYGSPSRKEHMYENVRITRNAHDSNFCAVNPKYVSVVTESGGGGTFLVLPLERTGRIDTSGSRVLGHSGSVLDIKWNPFNDSMIASCSDDCTVKLWQIPREGLATPLTEWWVDLHGHTRRVGYLEWHPTAENILLSAGFDYKCVLWNIEQAEPVNIIDCHTDTIFSMDWNRDGSMFATTSKDKKLRTIDPRTTTVAVESQCHKGPKASKVVFVDNVKMATTGFAQMGSRELCLWDMRKSKTAIHTVDLDSSCGVMLPYYDYDTKVIFLAGKGDGNIRYFEVSDTDSCFHFLNAYQSPSPQRGLGVMPKRGCDTKRCEITRFYKLHAAKNLVEPISMIVPRKSDAFQDDVYPPTASTIPSLRADEWISGQNREPILVSMMDGTVVSSPQITTSKAVQKQDGTLQSAPTITTYKAVDRAARQPTSQVPSHTQSSAVKLRRHNDASRPHNEAVPASEPASLKNIKRLSLNEDIVIVPGNASSASSVISSFHRNDKSARVTPPGAQPSTNGTSTLEAEPQSALRPSSSSTSSSTKAQIFTSSLQLDSNSIGSGRQRRGGNRFQTIGHSSEHTSQIKTVLAASSDPATTNLKKAYFRQLEEINSLKEQLSLKDKRIRQLETELNTLKEREESVGPGESNC